MNVIESIEIDVDVEGNYNTPVMTITIDGDFSEMYQRCARLYEYDIAGIGPLQFRINRQEAEKLVNDISRYLT